MKHKSIRFKWTAWFSLALIVITGVTLLGVLTASRTVLHATIRNYLISVVEENVQNICYVTEKDAVADNNYIPYGDGFLQIDLNFMDIVYDVHTALYTEDATMLYGENPLSKQTSDLEFTTSHTWHLVVDDVGYDLYDRRLTLDLPEGEALWIRGVVPETKSAAQLAEIIRLSLLLLPVMILLSVFCGYIFAGRLLSPLQKMEKEAAEISKGDDLKRRIDVESEDEVGRLAKEFNRMLDRLEHSFETERRFTSDASHELRTPTAVILAQSDYILEKERPAEEYVEALEVVQKQGRRMHSLIEDMLDYTRMEQGTKRYPFELVDLSQLVRESVEQMSLLEEKGITLSAQVQEGVRLLGNRGLLQRLLQNLIGNAYRYGKENGHTSVTLSQEDGRIVLSVADDGIGIAEDEQEKIFERFYRSDASRSVQGTGLGLSMVKKIAQLHGAQIEVQSKPGEGSTFRVLFARG